MWGFVFSLAHTDLTDLTDFFCGWEISRIVWGFVFSWAHTDLTDLTDFFVGGKSHRIVWWESRGGFLIFIFYD